jgi:Arc/MetJ-type ribon-helix-helix transcriptional regulator
METTLNIRLSSALHRWVEEQTRKGGFESPDKYMQRLLREERRRQVRQSVETKLIDALKDGEPVAVTDETWRDTERRVEKRLTASRRKRLANGKRR